MAAPHDPPGRTGTRIVALVLAVLFLAVIGGSVGYILGLRHNHTQRLRADDAGTAPTTAPATGGGTGRPTGSGGGTAKACLPETERDAKAKFGSPGGLTQIFYVKTLKSEGWICRDSAKTLFYQGHTRSAPEQQGGPRAPLVDGNNSILLKNPHTEGDGWVAENAAGGSTTRYHLSADELVVEQPNKAPDHQPALEHEP